MHCTAIQCNLRQNSRIPLYSSAMRSIMAYELLYIFHGLNSLIPILICMWNNVSVPASMQQGRNRHLAPIDALSAEQQCMPFGTPNCLYFLIFSYLYPCNMLILKTLELWRLPCGYRGLWHRFFCFCTRFCSSDIVSYRNLYGK